VPEQNDSEEELKKLVNFIVEKAGPDVPWHISRFYPQHRYLDAIATPMSSLERAYEIGVSSGLRYIYFGNVPGSEAESTFCYHCGKKLIERIGYRIGANHVKDSKCPDCGTEIAGYAL
jgi:pyruvate formate lyase activating enzyme